MNAIKGTWKNGQIVLGEPVNWPDGCEVLVELVREEESLGIREEDWRDTPEAIAEWLRWYDSLEPLAMTAEEEAEWKAALKQQREYDKSKWEERCNRIERLFP